MRQLVDAWWWLTNTPFYLIPHIRIAFCSSSSSSSFSSLFCFLSWNCDFEVGRKTTGEEGKRVDDDVYQSNSVITRWWSKIMHYHLISLASTYLSKISLNSKFLVSIIFSKIMCNLWWRISLRMICFHQTMIKKNQSPSFGWDCTGMIFDLEKKKYGLFFDRLTKLPKVSDTQCSNLKLLGVSLERANSHRNRSLRHGWFLFL